MKDNSFLGVGWSFPPEFDKDSEENKMSGEEEDIRQSLFILLSTNPGERIMHPAFGCGIKRMVFDRIKLSTITVLKDLVTKAILFFEPRIDLDSVDINTERADEGLLLINIYYTIRTTNSRSNMVYPYYFIEGSNV